MESLESSDQITIIIKKGENDGETNCKEDNVKASAQIFDLFCNQFLYFAPLIFLN